MMSRNLESVQKRIGQALKEKKLVRIFRNVEEGFVAGYVLQKSNDLFLVGIISDDIVPNGFQVFRIADVNDIELPHPHTKFFETAMRLRHESVPQVPRVDVGSFRKLLDSVGEEFDLVTIHREIQAPEICHIGRVQGTDDFNVTLLEIDGNAEWEDGCNSYNLEEITRVDFGSMYESALSLVSRAAGTN